jgi:flagella basal body P-ring formation protein FlgA
MMIASLLTLVTAQALPAAVDTPVLRRIVERGEILSADDFTAEPRPASQGRGAMLPNAANGMEAARRLPAGAVVRASDVLTPRLVRRGEPVTIYVRSGGLTISTAGRALDNGAKGDLVRVVANSTNRTLDAEVEGSGAVRVTAP